MVHNKEWHLRRKTGITGTDIVAICGLSSYKTALDVYQEKINDQINEDHISDAALFGSLFESVVANEYAKRYNVTVQEESELIRHKEHEFMIGNIDRWVNNGEYLLEVKTTSFRNGANLGQEDTSQVPEYWLVQCAWYMAVANKDRIDIAALIGGQKFKRFIIKRQPQLEKKLIQIAAKFWNDNVKNKVPPRAVNQSDVCKLYPIASEDIITATSTLHQQIQRYKDLTLECEKLKANIQDEMQDKAAVVDSQGQILVTWKNSNPRRTFDSKRFANEHPDMYQDYIRETKPSRVFLIK